MILTCLNYDNCFCSFPCSVSLSVQKNARCIRNKLTHSIPFLIGQQFMLGNYSFVIKALDPKNNTVKEGFKFAEPITIAMFYDVDNLVKANRKHVNNELTKEDIDPVLYLWDPQNETW